MSEGLMGNTTSCKSCEQYNEETSLSRRTRSPMLGSAYAYLHRRIGKECAERQYAYVIRSRIMLSV